MPRRRRAAAVRQAERLAERRRLASLERFGYGVNLFAVPDVLMTYLLYQNRFSWAPRSCAFRNRPSARHQNGAHNGPQIDYLTTSA